MKLVRYGAKGAEKPGLIDKSGQLRDLSAHVKDLDGEAYAPASLAKLAGLDASKLPAVSGSPRFGAPVQIAQSVYGGATVAAILVIGAAVMFAATAAWGKRRSTT